MAQTAPPVHALLDVAQAALDLQHLVFLDEIWTRAEEMGESNDQDRESLIALGDRLHDGLVTADRRVQVLRDFCSTYGSWSNEQRYGDVIARTVAEPRTSQIARILAIDGGNIAERVVSLADSLLEQLPAERDELLTKVNNLRSGGQAVTDISHDTACGIMAIATMGSILLCPETGLACVGAVGGLVALGEYCS